MVGQPENLPKKKKKMVAVMAWVKKHRERRGNKPKSGRLWEKIVVRVADFR